MIPQTANEYLVGGAEGIHGEFMNIGIGPQARPESPIWA
jgi:hypothetical protein